MNLPSNIKGFEIDNGVIAIVGPTRTGKDTLANMIATNSQLYELGKNVVPSHKFIFDPDRDRPDDASSKGQIVAVARSERQWRKLQKNNDFAFIYDHDGRPYAQGSEPLLQGRDAMVPAVLDQNGVEKLKIRVSEISKGTDTPMGIVRYVLLHASEADLVRRMTADGWNDERQKNTLERYKDHMQEYLAHLSDYPMIFCTSMGDISPDAPSEQVWARRANTINKTYSRLINALIEGVAGHDDTRRYMDNQARRLANHLGGVQDLADSFSDSKRWGVELNFDEEDIEKYAEMNSISVGELRKSLPKAIAAYQKSYGVLNMVLRMEGNPHDTMTSDTVGFLKYLLGEPQFINESPQDSEVIGHGFCKVEGSGVYVIGSWGFRDMPVFTRKPEQNIDRLLISVASDSRSKPQLTPFTKDELETFYIESVQGKRVVY